MRASCSIDDPRASELRSYYESLLAIQEKYKERVKSHRRALLYSTHTAIGRWLGILLCLDSRMLFSPPGLNENLFDSLGL